MEFHMFMVVIFPSVHTPTAFLHRVTLQWERWWMRLLAPSQRWHSTSQHCCRDTRLPTNVTKRWSKQHSPEPYLDVYCSYLWVPKRDRWTGYHVGWSLCMFNILILFATTAAVFNYKIQVRNGWTSAHALISWYVSDKCTGYLHDHWGH